MSDLIKREDAIEAVWKPQVRPNGAIFDALKAAIESEIKAIPSADRPQGEWIVNVSDYKSVCSVCGASETDFIYGTEMWYGLGESKFCPSCGARMKGADDERVR